MDWAYSRYIPPKQWSLSEGTHSVTGLTQSVPASALSFLKTVMSELFLSSLPTVAMSPRAARDFRVQGRSNAPVVSVSQNGMVNARFTECMQASKEASMHSRLLQLDGVRRWSYPSNPLQTGHPLNWSLTMQQLAPRSMWVWRQEHWILGGLTTWQKTWSVSATPTLFECRERSLHMLDQSNNLCWLVGC